MTFWGLLKMSKHAQLSDGYITMTWLEARELAERGQSLEIELDQLKRDLANCIQNVDRAQFKLLKEGLDGLGSS